MVGSSRLRSFSVRLEISFGLKVKVSLSRALSVASGSVVYDLRALFDESLLSLLPFSGCYTVEKWWRAASTVLFLLIFG